MRSQEFTGKTTQEAIDAGLAALGVTIADVHVDVIQEGAKGLFGLFGSKPACVRLTVMEEEKEDDHGLGDLLSSFSLNEPRKKPAQKPAAPKPETPAGFWPALSEKLRAELSAKDRGFFAANGPLHPVLQGESTLIMAADNEFVLGMVKKPAIEQLIREKASALLGRPVSVRFALKNRLSRVGDDPMDALVQFGEQHSDIFTIK